MLRACAVFDSERGCSGMFSEWCGEEGAGDGGALA